MSPGELRSPIISTPNTKIGGLPLPAEFQNLSEQGLTTWAHLSTLYGDKNFGAQADPLFLASARLVGGEAKFSKWRTFLDVCVLDYDAQRFINRINNRSILRCEVVIDIDRPTYEECTVWFQKVCEQLDLRQIGYLGYSTGSKGYHIHIFIPKLRTYPHTDKYKEVVINRFGGDAAKSNRKVMIALENTPHWKTGRTKTLVRQNGDGINDIIPLVR